MELTFGPSRYVAATCMSFPAGDINNFIVGSEEGAVYQVRVNRKIALCCKTVMKAWTGCFTLFGCCWIHVA